MKHRLVALLALGLFATSAHAQGLNGLLGELTANMGRIGAEEQATKAALDSGDLSGACQHVSAWAAYADAANGNLDAMQAGLDANTDMSDAVRADWQFHINDARASVGALAESARRDLSTYCS